jgi:hypothetical protein
VTGRHDWLLLGPAYAEQDSRPARDSQPLLHKYDDSNCAMRYTADPRATLPFTDEDVVYRLVRPAPPPGMFVLAEEPLEREPDPNGRVLEKLDIRKLFLHAHKRFYVVACELHCDAAGLPNVERDAVCEAGFVIRRRRVVYPLGEGKRARRILSGLIRAESDFVRVVSPPAPRIAFAAAGAAPAASVVHAAARDVLERRVELDEWFAGVGGRIAIEGWLPDPELDGIGAWDAVSGEPAQLVEHAFPLYPLVPDPKDEAHAASGRTIFFGVVPTASADHDEDGVPRFDTESCYEIRCFVRRHDAHCPKKIEPGDCRGPLVWSRATQVYRLAAQHDLLGTSNRPVTVQMPNLPELMAQMKELPLGPRLADGTRGPAPRGGGMPMKFAFPERSLPTFSVTPPSPIPFAPGLSGGTFCFQPIPLVTIVALVVYNIFKPIVVQIFRLHPLDITICLPASLDVSAELLARIGIPDAGFASGLSYGGGS